MGRDFMERTSPGGSRSQTGDSSGASGECSCSTTAIRVRFADTDMMGVVYNSNFLVWFEVGRTELLRERGLTYKEVEERGFSLPVTEAALKIRRPAHYDDVLRIETTVDEVRSRRIAFSYRILRSAELLVEGMTAHVPYDRTAARAVPAPRWMVDALGEPRRITETPGDVAG